MAQYDAREPIDLHPGTELLMPMFNANLSHWKALADGTVHPTMRRALLDVLRWQLGDDARTRARIGV